MIWIISMIALVVAIVYLTVIKPQGKSKKGKLSLPVMILSGVTFVWFIIGAFIMATNSKVNVIEIGVEKVAIEAKLAIFKKDEDVKKAKQFNTDLFFTKLKSSYYIFTFDNNEDLNAIKPIDIK